MRPTVALLTDFGTQDHYVGAVKGAILTICPEASLVDVVHELPPHDIVEAAFSLASAYRFFPKGTVFVAVVDPGVGTRRRGLALAAGGYLFVGPDNGIFSSILGEHADARVHVLADPSLFRPEVSATFHARDVFGPVAAHLARGVPLDRVGPQIEDPEIFALERIRKLGPEEWEAVVIHVDRFGNLTTNLSKKELGEILREIGPLKPGAGGDTTDLVVIVEGMVLPVVQTYGDVAQGEACALVGSGGRLEVAVHRGSAARLLGVAKGAPVRVRVARSGERRIRVL